MKKIIAVISVIVVLMTFFAVSTFAYENGEYASLWGNGLKNPWHTGSSSPYGAIYVRPSDTFLVEIVDYTQTDWFTGVRYRLKFNPDFSQVGVNPDNDTVVYIVYDTERYVNPSYSIIEGNTVASIDFELVTLTADDGVYKAYSRNIISTNTYTYEFSEDVTAIAYTINWSGEGETKIDFSFNFSDSDSSLITKKYDSFWQGFSNLVTNSNIETVGAYLKQLIEIAWVYKFILIGVLAIALGLFINWLKTL